MSSSSPEHIILQTKRLVESDKRSEIRLNANGGNSIMIVCDPGRELEYIQSIRQLMEEDTYKVIDLNDILNNFVSANQDDLEAYFSLLKGSVHQIFKSPEHETGPDLFGQIISAVNQATSLGKIPVLIRTGCLYGSGIDNIHIMEHESVMRSSLPLIILYPATKQGDMLLFLSQRPASNYRCMIIS